jgi:hypothetical protein
VEIVIPKNGEDLSGFTEPNHALGHHSYRAAELEAQGYDRYDPNAVLLQTVETLPKMETFNYKRMLRDNAVVAMKKVKEDDKPDKITAVYAQNPYQRKYKRAVTIKPPPVNAKPEASKKKKMKRDVTLQTGLDELKLFRKGMTGPAPHLGLVSEEHFQFSSTVEPTKSGGNEAASELRSPVEETKEIINPFAIMCDDTMNSLAEFESAMQTFSVWKNDFLKQNVTSGVKLNLAMMIAKIIRTQSDLSQMVLELVRSVRVFSSQWTSKLNALAELEEEHTRQSRAFDVVIRKLESMHTQVIRNRSNRRVFLWEFLTKKLLRKLQQDAEAGESESDDSEEEIDEKAENQDSTGPQDPLSSTQTKASARRRSMSGHHKRKKELAKSVSDEHRVAEMKAILDAKKKARERAKLERQSYEIPERDLLQQRFNEILNRNFPHLPRSIFAFMNFKRHSPMYYASEVLILEASEVDIVATRRHLWTMDDVNELAKPIQLRGLVRSNSTNAIKQLPKFISNKFVPLKEQELMQKASDGLMRAIRSKMPPPSQHFDEIIRREKARTGSDLMVDLNKTWFTLKDVVELSLLHMHQIQQLRDEYEYESVFFLNSLFASAEIQSEQETIYRSNDVYLLQEQSDSIDSYQCAKSYDSEELAKCTFTDGVKIIYSHR